MSPGFVQLIDSFPFSYQDHFVLLVSEFMYNPWKYAKEQTLARVSLQNGDTCTPSITAAAAESIESEMQEYLKGQVRTMILLLYLKCNPLRLIIF